MPGTNLTRGEAADRSRTVRDVAYEVTLDLTAGPSTFATTSTIRFAATPGADTFVDFVGDSIAQIDLNGRAIDPRAAYADSRVSLTDLAADNVLTIHATGAYTNTGEGLHRFVDPVDGEVYLYSQFEVPDARRVFACFEQPDLKATFTFTVTAPSHWEVLSNAPTPEPEMLPVEGGTPHEAPRARWTFPTTDRFSTYISALVAGPYASVRDSVTTRLGEVPLGIFCRRSLVDHLDHEELFALTKAGFAFFEEEFDHAYPFGKYDQIFTPEYNMGAMENVGCVTVHEMYIFRSKVTESLIERRALTLLHELAHMWFGNLVTMRWWDDLWLNESFAEWASTTAQAEATRWVDAWTTFCTSEKDWAYRQDQLSSTHPIVADIKDLHDVEVNFDGITYAKGASVLKQLVAYVGRDAFRRGVRAYFRTHAWGNTSLSDLLDELEAASGRDLRAWSAIWLQTAGVNTLRPIVGVDDRGLIASAVIEQGAADSPPTLRPHRLAIGLYAARDGALVRTGRVEIDVDGARTEVPELIGLEQPDLLLVNDDDLAYAKIRLDPRSLATALSNPRGFTESLPRSLVLASAWDMTRDAEMGARAYIDLALAALPGADDSTLVKILCGQLHTGVFSYTAPELREATRLRTRARLWTLAAEARPGSDAQLQLVGAAAAMTTPADREATGALERAAYLLDLRDGRAELAGLVVDTDLRWTLVTALAGAGLLGVAEIDAEQERDNTATGREKAARARASIPTAEAKAAAWTIGVEGRDTANTIIEHLGMGFGRVGAEDVLEGYVERYHALLDTVTEGRSHAIVEAIVHGFYPRALASRGLRDATDAWLDAHPDVPDALRRLVAENRDPITRALAAQARDAADPV